MYFREINDVTKEVNVDLTKGLSSEEVKKRIEKYGENRLKEAKQKSFFSLFISQFMDVLILILMVAALISTAMGEYTEGLVILIIVLLNSFIGAKQEKSAGDAVRALREMTSPSTKVLRNGKVVEVESPNLVVGDVVLLESGNYVTADLRLFETINMQIEESSLTGESVPVEKNAKVVLDEKTPLSERENMAFSGTMVTYGRGKGVVVATAMETEMGSIAKMLDVEDEETPLQLKLNKLGKMLGVACLAVCAIVFLLGIIEKNGLFEMFMTAISLAVAAVPEGLPAIVTVVLAIGMKRMVSKNVLTKNLSSVETLGSTTVICSDKTGTLTQNKMNVKKVFDLNEEVDVTGSGYSSDGKIGENYDVNKLRMLLLASALCNDSEINEQGNGVIGDPTEGALVVFARKAKYDYKELREKYSRIQEYPFDSDRKMMSTLHKIDGKNILLVKGAPDSIMANSSSILVNGEIKNINEYKDKIVEVNNKWASDALRVLAYAYKELDSENLKLQNEENNLVFVGLTGMIDPPREEAKAAIEKCHSAGIRVVMITGDNAITAAAIGKEIGLLDKNSKAITGAEIDEMTDEEFSKIVEEINVFSRVSPKHKVKIVDALKQKDEIVAMTGDGVNDAPSLKKADIGIAMGITGTDVSKEAADMILTDDNFASIVAAVEEGRVIFSNIRKFVGFLISCNIGEILVIFISMLFGWGVPLMPIHLLYINLITDSLPAFALGLEKKEDDVMDKKPRDPKEDIINKNMKISIAFQSIALAFATLVSYLYGCSLDKLAVASGTSYGSTFAFITIISGELLRAYSGRSEDKFLVQIGIFSNKNMNYAVIGSYIVTTLIIFIPAFRNIFEIHVLTIGQYAIAIALSFIPLIAGELSKFVKVKK